MPDHVISVDHVARTAHHELRASTRDKNRVVYKMEVAHSVLNMKRLEAHVWCTSLDMFNIHRSFISTSPSVHTYDCILVPWWPGNGREEHSILVHGWAGLLYRCKLIRMAAIPRSHSEGALKENSEANASNEWNSGWCTESLLYVKGDIFWS